MWLTFEARRPCLTTETQLAWLIDDTSIIDSTLYSNTAGKFWGECRCLTWCPRKSRNSRWACKRWREEELQAALRHQLINTQLSLVYTSSSRRRRHSLTCTSKKFWRHVAPRHSDATSSTVIGPLRTFVGFSCFSREHRRRRLWNRSADIRK